MSWGHCRPSHPKEKFCTGSDFLSMAICAVDLTFPSPLTLGKLFISLRDMNSFPKLGPRTLIRGHHKQSTVVQLDSMGMIFYSSLIVPEAVSCTVSEI